MWVTHQNLAAAKGGYPGYQFKERKLPAARPKVPSSRVKAEAPAILEPSVEPNSSRLEPEA